MDKSHQLLFHSQICHPVLQIYKGYSEYGYLYIQIGLFESFLSQFGFNNYRQVMNSRLRNRIRKVEPKPVRLETLDSQTKDRFATAFNNTLNRRFGAPSNVDLNAPHLKSKASGIQGKRKAKVLGKRKERRQGKSMEKSPSSNIQNEVLAQEPLNFNETREQDLFSQIPVVCSHVNDYLPDICKYLYSKDQKMPVLGDIFADKMEVSQRMRITLVDWLHKISYKFKLRPQTLFRCLAILDSFTKSSQIIHKRNYQLVGITCLYIACKFEEIYPPSNQTFVGVSGKLYTFQNILQMEGIILKQTEFNINMTTSQTHLERLAMMMGLGEEDLQVARYLNQLSVYNIGLYEYSPLTLAGAIMLLVKRVSNGISQNRLRCLEVDWEKAEHCCLELQESVRNPLKALDPTVLQIKYPTQLINLQSLFALQ